MVSGIDGSSSLSLKLNKVALGNSDPFLSLRINAGMSGFSACFAWVWRIPSTLRPPFPASGACLGRPLEDARGGVLPTCNCLRRLHIDRLIQSRIVIDGQFNFIHPMRGCGDGDCPRLRAQRTSFPHNSGEKLQGISNQQPEQAGTTDSGWEEHTLGVQLPQHELCSQ
jgi:hypothetical protein